jgi:hypothetical protein
LTGVTVDYTIAMPGYILEQGQATLSSGTFSFDYDPVELKADFPNLDLRNRYDLESGLSDTISIGILLSGDDGGETVYRANIVMLQGEQVFVSGAAARTETFVYLPVVTK